MSFGEDVAGFDHAAVTVNGVTLHVVIGGKGPLIVLLHGWPSTWITWRYVMRPLVDAGFTVAVPDLRGFGDSEKPAHVDAYRLDNVAADIDALIGALGFHSAAAVVGHDWGGATAWHMAQHNSARVERFVILNAPHPAVFAKRLRTLEQLRASYYMFLFQVPVLAERAVSKNDFRPIKNIFKYQPKRKGGFDGDDIRLAVDAMKKPGALTSGLGYYRAAFREAITGKAPDARKATDKPVLLLWGVDDAALPLGNLDGVERWVPDLRVVKLSECSHWVQHDQPEAVVRETVAFARM